MKRPQWITVIVAVLLTAVLYKYGRTVAVKNGGLVPAATQNADMGPSTDTILAQAKKKLTPEQMVKVDELEHSVVRGTVKDQQLKVYHQLARFWADSEQVFEPYAWYEAEAARLENSEKTLTFAAHLFLQNLRGESDPGLKTWKAFQAKDLFERSLKINPDNDSSTVGLGACYIFGGISATPMEGILKVRAVAEKDSTNLFAQEVLGQGSMFSGQYDKAQSRFETVYRLSAGNIDLKLEATLMLAEIYEKKGDKAGAIEWYKTSQSLIRNKDIKAEVEKRIDDLKSN